MRKNFDDVRELHESFAIAVNDTPHLLCRRLAQERIDFIGEELDELYDAMSADDINEIADALIDIVVVAMGTAAMMGLPWQELWDDVHRANMAKERGVGKRGNAVDLIKPEGWVPPHTRDILQEAGYNFDNPPEPHDDRRTKIS